MVGSRYAESCMENPPLSHDAIGYWSIKNPPADLPSVLGSEEWDAALTKGLPLLRSDP